MIVPDSVLVEAARFAPRVVPLRRDNGRIWWMPLPEAQKTAATVRGLWRADVLRSRGGIAVVMVRRDLGLNAPLPVRLDWSKPQHCLKCERLMRPGDVLKKDLPGTVVYGAYGKCGSCVTKERGVRW